MSQEIKVTSAWRIKGGKIAFRPLQLEKNNPKKEFFDGYSLEEFDNKVPNAKCFPLPVNLIEFLELNDN